MVIGNKFEHAEGLAGWDVRWHAARLGQFKLSLFVGAHFFEDRHLIRSLVDNLGALFIQSRHKGVPFVGFNVSHVLDVSALGKMEAFARLQICSPCPHHCHVEQMAGRVDTGEESALGLVNVAVDLASLCKSRVARFESTHVHNNVVLDGQSFNAKLSGSLSEEAVIAGLAASLRMQNSFVKHDNLLARGDAFSRGMHTEHAVAARKELRKASSYKEGLSESLLGTSLRSTRAQSSEKLAGPVP